MTGYFFNSGRRINFIASLNLCITPPGLVIPTFAAQEKPCSYLDTDAPRNSLSGSCHLDRSHDSVFLS
jgi:hypothetical protein